MTDHVARLYAVALALVVFCLTWAVVAARPWAHEAEDPRVLALERREERLRKESVRVQRLVERRFAAYRVRLREREQAIAAAQAAAVPVASTASAPAASASVPVASPAAAPAPAPPPAPVVSVVPAAPVTATSSS